MKVLWLVNEGNKKTITESGLYFINTHKIIFDNDNYQTQKTDKFKNIDALVVQVNVCWYSKDIPYDGIKLVQDIRKSKLFNKPIVFLSLTANREKLLENNPEYAILSTFGLGNGFCYLTKKQPNFTLPIDIDSNTKIKNIEEYINLLPEMDQARERDIQYFCKREMQVQRIRHDLFNGNYQIEVIKNTLIKLYGESNEIRSAKTKEALKELCNTLEQEKGKEDVFIQRIENRIKVLLLDDKYDESEGLKYFVKYSKNKLDIKCCKTVVEAEGLLFDFKPQVVLVDLRLESDGDFPVINEKQGYDYLKIHKEKYSHIGFIVLSRLPMSFLKDLSRSVSNFRTFYWKKELEKGNTYCDILIQNIIEMAVIEFTTESYQKTEFKKLYEWWYGINEKESQSNPQCDIPYSGKPFLTCEEYVDGRSKEIIDIIKAGDAFFLDEKDKHIIHDAFKDNNLQIKKYNEDESLTKLFIFRRVAIYLYYHFENNVKVDKEMTLHVIDKNGKILFNRKKELSLFINYILANQFVSAENFAITTRYLYLRGKNGRIYSYKDIALTNREKTFFCNKYPDFYNHWSS